MKVESIQCLFYRGSVGEKMCAPSIRDIMSFSHDSTIPLLFLVLSTACNLIKIIRGGCRHLWQQHFCKSSHWGEAAKYLVGVIRALLLLADFTAVPSSGWDHTWLTLAVLHRTEAALSCCHTDIDTCTYMNIYTLHWMKIMLTQNNAHRTVSPVNRPHW